MSENFKKKEDQVELSEQIGFEDLSKNNSYDEELRKAKFEYDNVVILNAGEIEKGLIKKNWPHKDFSFEEWEANGALVTREGVPSKLNEKQYRQVRTTKFFEWFGDWQNNPENSSQIIDEVSGEPMVLYRGDGTKHKDHYLLKDEKVIDQGYKNDQGIFFTNKKDTAIGYSEDTSGHLGTFGKSYELDHPETFEDVKKHAISVIQSDRAFWYKAYHLHLPNFQRWLSDINSTDNEVDKDAERRFKETLGLYNFDKDLIDGIYENIKTLGLRGYVDANRVADSFIKVGKFEEFLGLVNTYLHGGDETNYSNLSQDASDLFKDKQKDFKLEPRIVKQVFVNARKIYEVNDTDISGGREILKAKKDGYDLAWGKNAVGGGRAHEYIVFDTRNIKSATDNNGMFDPDSAKLSD